MKTLFTFLCCCICAIGYAQQDLKIFSEKKNNGYILYASNNAFCPVSVSLDLDLTNLSFKGGQQKVFVIPERANKWKLGELDVLFRNEMYRYSFRFHFNLGDINKVEYDTAYQYDLPYLKGERFRVFQGYNGALSHQNENALDFGMPEGTEIAAAREGIVIKVVENNTESCPQEECKKFNNYITVYHSDGTMAEYTHIKYNGSTVEVGDRIKKGDLIGYSGNTGWSSGPHLHFICFLPGLEKRRSIRTRFKIDDGSKAEYLEEKVIYLRDY